MTDLITEASTDLEVTQTRNSIRISGLSEHIISEIIKPLIKTQKLVQKAK